MNNDTYNGWTNYQTWDWKLWLDNDEGSYNYWREAAQEVIERVRADEHDLSWDTDELAQQRALADMLEQDADEQIDLLLEELHTGPIVDLLNHAVGVINWYEIAEHLIDEVREG